MHLLKWFFQPVTLLLIIVAITLYINRDTVFSDTTYSTEVEAVLNRVDSLVESLKSDTTVVAGAEEKTIAAPTEIAPASQPGEMSTGESISDAEGTKKTVENPVALKSIENNAEGSIEKNSGISDAMKASVEPTMIAESEFVQEQVSEDAITMESKALVQEPDHTDSQVPVELSEEQAATVQTHATSEERLNEQLWNSWQQARSAAWNGDHATAIMHYRKIIALQPDNYDAYGEMGNVMLRAGDANGAAEAYYQAAHRLNKTENQKMAWHLLNVIATLSPQKADQLYQELTRK